MFPKELLYINSPTSRDYSAHPRKWNHHFKTITILEQEIPVDFSSFSAYNLSFAFS